MADFSFLSDTDESAVEQILAEARDHCVLKQVAAINCSSFSHSVLPSHLESRFQRLKTFPSSSNPKPQLGPDSATEFNDSTRSPRDENPVSGDSDKDPERERDLKGKSRSGYVSSSSNSSNSPIKAKRGDRKVKSRSLKGSARCDSGKVPERERDSEGKSRSRYISSPSDSSNSSFGHLDSPKMKAKSSDGKVRKGKSRTVKGSVRCDSSKFQERERDSEGKSHSGYVSSHCDDSPNFKAKSRDGKAKERKLRPGSFSFRSDSSDSSSDAAKKGCFWCSPKKVSRKKSGNRNGFAELGLDYGGHDEILSDLRSVSLKEQKKLVKKSMKEAEKINKEAEKIVKWAKQASARLDFSLSDDELSDDDHSHNFGLH